MKYKCPDSIIRNKEEGWKQGCKWCSSKLEDGTCVSKSIGNGKSYVCGRTLLRCVDNCDICLDRFK